MTREILLADDDHAYRSLLALRLKAELPGTVCHQARNGQEAIDTINEMRKKLTLVITDIQMPFADGNQVAERAIELDIPVIVLSANTRALRAEIASQCKAIFNVGSTPFKSLVTKIKEILQIE